MAIKLVTFCKQARRWQVLQQRIQQPYDSENSSHQDMLRLLWSHAFPGEACTSLVDPRWTEMGWQQRDPSTDFRGAGLIALENLIHLAQVHCLLQSFSRLIVPDFCKTRLVPGCNRPQSGKMLIHIYHCICSIDV